jgi:hypothetical protein
MEIMASTMTLSPPFVTIEPYFCAGVILERGHVGIVPGSRDKSGLVNSAARHSVIRC